MPRKSKPARLYLERRDGREAVWTILDKGRKIRTGFFEDQTEEAEQAFVEYSASKRVPAGERCSAQVSVAEILAYYFENHVPTVARPDVPEMSLSFLIEFWQGKTVADIRKSSCTKYAKWRMEEKGGSEDRARRDLVTLSAAIGFYHEEYPLDVLPAVTKPAKAETSGDWLTRQEVARALWAAWRGHKAKHLARLILIMIYSGTRPGTVLKLRWQPSEHGGWFELERGRLYRKGRRAVETKKRQPSSAIHVRLLPHLRRWKAKDEKDGAEFVVHYYRKEVEKVKKSWQALRERAKLPNWAIPYTLRHTAATWQMQAGTDEFAAAGLLGMSVEMLRKVYGHHHPDFQAEAARATVAKRKAA